MSETLISVDIEAAGPVPSRYSMLSLGACVVDDISDEFYVELQPTSDDFIPAALEVSGFDLERLKREGQPPTDAIAKFDAWIGRFEKPVFVGFNATFDWAFVNLYFLEFGVEHRNPFGIGGLDIKAYAMGRLRSTWDETRSSLLSQRFGVPHEPTHNALDDARQQARLFRAIRASL